MKKNKIARAGLGFVLGVASVSAAIGADLNYSRHARELIAQAVRTGPSAYTRLTIKNPQNGAVGAAERVAKDGDPKDAADIMLEVAQALIGFANITPKDYKGHPTQASFYCYAMDELNASLKYIDQLAKTDPLGASDLAIRVATVLANANPPTKDLRNSFRFRAKTILADGVSAASVYAKKIPDPVARKSQLTKIEIQRKALGL
jgi:hypothetical protein